MRLFKKKSSPPISFKKRVDTFGIKYCSNSTFSKAGWKKYTYPILKICDDTNKIFGTNITVASYYGDNPYWFAITIKLDLNSIDEIALFEEILKGEGALIE